MDILTWIVSPELRIILHDGGVCRYAHRYRVHIERGKGCLGYVLAWGNDLLTMIDVSRMFSEIAPMGLYEFIDECPDYPH